MTTAIVKANTQLVRVAPSQNVDAFLLGMFLMYARAPRTPSPDVDNHFDLGEIGSAPEKNWTKATPYSLAKGK